MMIKKNIREKRSNKNKWYFVLLIFLGFGIWKGCEFFSPQNDLLAQNFIQAPLQGIDVPFKTDVIDNTTVNVLHYESGSVVIIPDNAFVDEQGKLVKSRIEIKFREFKDPIDLYLSGIPMNFEKNGGSYTFESASMCEIEAYSGEQKLRLKTNKKIEILQVSKSTNEKANLYRFDKKSGKWIEKGKDAPLNFIHLVDNKKNKNSKSPVKPNRANEYDFVFHLEFDANIYPELAIYKNTRFGLLYKENPSVSTDFNDVVWENIDLDKTKRKGTYQMTLSKDFGKIKLIVHPVFEGEDYNKALKKYEKKLTAYLKIKKEQKEKELILRRNRQLLDSMNNMINSRVVEQSKGSMSKANLDEDYEALYELLNSPLSSKDLISKLVKIIASDKVKVNTKFINKKYEEYENAVVLNEKRLFLIQQNIDEKTTQSLAKIPENIKSLNAAQKFIENTYDGLIGKTIVNNTTFRAYSIDGTGIWNVDYLLKQGERLMAQVQFNKENIKVKNIRMLYRDIQTVYVVDKVKGGYSLNYIPSSKNILFAVNEDNELFYCSNINEQIDSQSKGNVLIIEMYKAEIPLTDYAEVKKTLLEL